MNIATQTEYETQIKELEAQVSDLQEEMFQKRAALRVAQMECNKLRYDHEEIEKLVSGLIACGQYYDAKSDPVGLSTRGSLPLSGLVPQLHTAEKTSLYRMYAASDMYTPRKEEEGGRK